MYGNSGWPTNLCTKIHTSLIQPPHFRVRYSPTGTVEPSYSGICTTTATAVPSIHPSALVGVEAMIYAKRNEQLRQIENLSSTTWFISYSRIFWREIAMPILFDAFLPTSSPLQKQGDPCHFLPISWCLSCWKVNKYRYLFELIFDCFLLKIWLFKLGLVLFLEKTWSRI